jgi:hypothetical protein
VTLKKTLVPLGPWLALALAACSSSSNEPPPSDARVDTAGDAVADAGAGDAVDVGAGDGVGEAGMPFLPPEGTQRLVSGVAALVGSGPNSCTNEPGAGGDRWCGFVVPATAGVVPAATGKWELWVIDVTTVAQGETVKCDGTDSYCLRLSSNVYMDRFLGAGNDGFEGDTLIYEADADATAVQQFIGPISAWRPGWPAGRVLTSGKGVVCSGHKTAPVALCLQDESTNADGDVSYGLVAGPLPDENGGPLPLLENVLVTLGTDSATVGEFQVGFSPDGGHVAWSARPDAAGKETLKVQAIDDATTRVTVASDVTAWEISKDGTRWMWLRSFNHDDLVPSGTLEMAAFPGGEGVSTLATKVSNYEGIGTKGVLFRDAVVHTLGDLRLMPDRDAPATTTLIDQMVANVLTVADDASAVVYTKTITAVGNDVFVWTPTLGSPCTAWATPSGGSIASLMSGNRVVVWKQSDVLTQIASVASTSIASCATTTFGSNLLRFLPAGDERLVFLDDAADGAEAGILRVSDVGAQGPDRGTPLQHDVDPVYAPLVPALPAVLYAVAGTDDADGLYIYAGPLLGR